RRVLFRSRVGRRWTGGPRGGGGGRKRPRCRCAARQWRRRWPEPWCHGRRGGAARMTTALELVRRARRRLAAVVALSALLWGVSAALAVVAAAALVRLVVPLPAAVYAALWPLAGLAALASAGVVVWRARGVRSLERVALWIEERQPELRFALVTAIDPR